MKHGSLFSGIGGFDLAAEWMGWENVFHCEWNPFGQKVLKHYWPHSISYNDITKTDFSIHRGEIDIITGGFPCQPYSSAGKRLGKEDSRHLWPEMLRAIREIFPPWIVGENVRGLTNWNGGMVFDEVQADLEAIGYEVLPFLLPACAVNAPHRRDRIWLIANAKGNGWDKQWHGIDKWPEHIPQNGTKIWDIITTNGEIRNVTNTQQPGLQGCTNTGEIRTTQTDMGGQRNQSSTKFASKDNKSDWQTFPTVPPVCDGDDGLSDRLDSITFPKWRNESIKAGGNAVVPQVVYQIFKAIELCNHANTK